MEDSEVSENGGAIGWKEPEPPRDNLGERSTPTRHHPAQSTLHSDVRGKSTRDGFRHVGAVGYSSRSSLTDTTSFKKPEGE